MIFGKSRARVDRQALHAKERQNISDRSEQDVRKLKDQIEEVKTKAEKSTAESHAAELAEHHRFVAEFAKEARAELAPLVSKFTSVADRATSRDICKVLQRFAAREIEELGDNQIRALRVLTYCFMDLVIAAKPNAVCLFQDMNDPELGRILARLEGALDVPARAQTMLSEIESALTVIARADRGPSNARLRGRYELMRALATHELHDFDQKHGAALADAAAEDQARRHRNGLRQAGLLESPLE